MISIIIKLILVDNSIPYSFAFIESDSKRIYIFSYIRDYKLSLISTIAIISIIVKLILFCFD
jgi:hypothetical protein